MKTSNPRNFDAKEKRQNAKQLNINSIKRGNSCKEISNK